MNRDLIYFIIFIIGFIYLPHVLTHRIGWQVHEYGTQAPSLVFSCASDRPFVIERQVCSLSTKPQVSTTLHYTITVLCNRTAHSQHCLSASVEVRELNLKYAQATGELNPDPLRTSSRVYDHQTTKASIGIHYVQR